MLGLDVDQALERVGVLELHDEAQHGIETRFAFKTPADRIGDAVVVFALLVAGRTRRAEPTSTETTDRGSAGTPRPPRPQPVSEEPPRARASRSTSSVASRDPLPRRPGSRAAVTPPYGSLYILPHRCNPSGHAMSLTVRRPQFRLDDAGPVPVAARQPHVRAVRQRLHVRRHRLRAGDRRPCHSHRPGSHHRPRRHRGGRLVRPPGGPARAGPPLARQRHDGAVPRAPGDVCRRERRLRRVARRAKIEFHLAYIANLEATFTPLFKMVFDNRRQLFEGGDERIGTLMLWHFVEEIEHRSSALRIHHSHPGSLVPDTQGTPGLRPCSRHLQTHPLGLRVARTAGRSSHPPSVVGPAGLWLGTLRDRLPAVRHPDNASMPTHVPGRDLRTMVLHLAGPRRPDTIRRRSRSPRGCGNGTPPGTPGPTWPPTSGPDCKALEQREHQVPLLVPGVGVG